jgi:hypothetical protein
MGIQLKPWRTSGDFILIARQGPSSGTQWQSEPNVWNDDAIHKLARLTDRPVRVREKWHRYKRPLALDLENVWAVISHSSSCAVQAAIAGIPVFCHETSVAAAIGSSDLASIEEPYMPDRGEWLASLSWQQWTLDELRTGTWWA